MKVPQKNIVLKKLILLFFMIVVPLIIISCISLFSSNKKLVNETLKSLNDKNQVFTEALDSEFMMINESASAITAHSKVQTLSLISDLMSPYKKVEAVAQIREYITGIKGNSNLITNIKVYIPSVLKVYNTTSYKNGSYQTITLHQFDDLIASKKTNENPIYHYDNKLCMVILSSLNDPSNIVEVDFATTQLIKRLKAQNMYDDAYYLFYLQDTSYELNNINDYSLQETIKNADYINGIAHIKHNSIEYECFRSYLTYANAYYHQIIPSESFLEPYRLSSLYTIFFLVFMVVCVVIFLFGVIKLIHHPLSQLVHAFQAVEKGDLSIRITETEQSEFSYLFQGFNDMTIHLENVIDEVYNKDLLLQRAEFKQLQAQINPHFLYNSFFMLQRMIQNEMNEEAVMVSKELGVYFKYITRNNSDYELFKDEYRHAKIYSRIQSMRFDGRIITQFGELPIEYENMQVPRLILQPIIENAYNYGLENKIKDGLLKVCFHGVENGIEIMIEDNGEELSDDVLNQINNNIELSKNSFYSKEITGILNIFRRIRIFYKNSSTLSVSRSELGGMKVTIYLTERTEEVT